MGLPERAARIEKIRTLRVPIDGQSLKRLVDAGLTWLRTNKDTVNALNVFPVPDGDTGTNMVLTLQAAWNEIKDSGTHSLSEMAALVSKGALMGARGNSGVITSQILRGFSRGVHDKDVLDVETLVRAFGEARETAYKGVVRPVEGDDPDRHQGNCHRDRSSPGVGHGPDRNAGSGRQGRGRSR